MGKTIRKSCLDEKNCPRQRLDETITLDCTSDTDIIECSIENENDLKIFRSGLCRTPHSIQTPRTPLQDKELLNNHSINGCKSNSIDIRTSSRKTSEPTEASVKKKDLQLQTPCHVGNAKELNSGIKKIISTLKKTPDGPYLSLSKFRNIERWLKENEVEIVRTPPFANLSITPLTSSKRRTQPKCCKENKKYEESSIDSDVEGVLKAVYGDDWQKKNIQSRAKTEPKKKTKRFFSPASQTKKSDAGHLHSVRRNILNIQKLNLSDISDEENKFDNSAMSGVEVMNSSYSNEQMEANLIKSFKISRKTEGLGGSYESLYSTPVHKKKPKNMTSDKTEKKKQKPPSTKAISSSKELKTPKKTFLASLSVSTPTSKCHPDAHYYKVNFKSRKDELVRKLYKLYNTEVFDGKLMEDMNFSWNVKLRDTAGYCYNKRITKSTGEVIRLSRIEFSTKIVDRADRVRDTMIHELCHAAAWVIDATLDGHGEVWHKWASKAMSRFSELPPIRRCHNYDIVSKYVYRCTGCGYSIKRHSKSINTERKRCGHCYGSFELLINKKKKGKNEIPQFDTTRTLPTPNKFAMFVKENYHSVKSTKNDAKHSEIMKILSQKYASLKSGPKSAKKAEKEE